jgi:hypothetical protein
MSPEPSPNTPAGRPGSWYDRIENGIKAGVHDVFTDLHAAYVGVFFHGSAINQPYLTGRAAGDQEYAFSEFAGGIGDGLKTLLGGGKDLDSRLQQMSKEITGRGPDGPDHEHGRGL